MHLSRLCSKKVLFYVSMLNIVLVYVCVCVHACVEYLVVVDLDD